MSGFEASSEELAVLASIANANAKERTKKNAAQSVL